MIIGFDLRVPGPAWDPMRREQYLLRPDVAQPKSVDTAVWPAAPVPPRPDAADLWYWKMTDFWADAAALRKAAPEGTLIGVRLVERPGVTPPHDTPFGAAEELPAALDAGWSSLGFDVADPFLTSGLANCGYAPGERRRLRAAWAGRLNEHGLVRTEADAIELCRATDARVEEHAPFFVFELFACDDGA